MGVVIVTDQWSNYSLTRFEQNALMPWQRRSAYDGAIYDPLNGQNYSLI